MDHTLVGARQGGPTLHPRPPNDHPGVLTRRLLFTSSPNRRSLCYAWPPAPNRSPALWQLVVDSVDAQQDVWADAYVPDEHFAINQLVSHDTPFSHHGLTHVVGYSWSDGNAHAITIDCTDDALDQSHLDELANGFGQKKLLRRDEAIHEFAATHDYARSIALHQREGERSASLPCRPSPPALRSLRH